MAGSRNGLGRLGLLAFGAAGLLMMQAAPAGAQASTALQPERVRRQAMWQGLEQRWEALREELTRTALHTALTMFFIRSSPPPPTPPPPPPPPVNPPPKGPNNPPPADPPTGTPTGQGDPPQIVDPPPQSAPEPASIVIALMGAGLAAGYRWRKRRVAN